MKHSVSLYLEREGAGKPVTCSVLGMTEVTLENVYCR